MKTRKILLGLFLLVVLASLCFVACGDNGDATTPAATTTAAPAATTTAAAATTTATPTTTAPAGPQAIPSIDEVELNVSNDITYTGSALKGNAYALANVRKIQQYVSVAYTFKKVDAEGNMIADLGTDRPVDAGRYTVTATFTFNEGYTAEQYILPEPMTATLVINPADASKLANFKLNDTVKYFVPGSTYTLELEGTLPNGVSVTYTMKNAAGETVESANAIGVYTVTATFTNTTENFTAIAPVTATLTIEKAPKEVLKYTPVMDGKVDQAYLSSAVVYTSTDLTVDPREYVVLNQVWITSGETDPEKYAHTTGAFYMLWDGDYIYFCAAMHDKTMFPRSNEYTKTADPWLNENLEVYYLMGNDDAKVAAGTEEVGKAPNAEKLGGKTSIYPHYKGMSLDSLARTKTAIYAQASMYFNDIEVAGTHEPDGQGGYYYTLEMKFPAKQETVELLDGYTDPRKATEETLRKIEGRKLKAGDFAYFCFQIDDLTSWPEGYEYPEVPPKNDQGEIDFTELDKVLQKGPCACYGNKTSHDASTFIYYLLTDTEYKVEVAVDGAADADYAKGVTLEGVACDEAGAPITAPAGANTVTSKAVVGTDGKLYIYTNVIDTDVAEGDEILYTLTAGEKTLEITVTAEGAATVEGGSVTVTPVKGTVTNGYAHEFAIDLAAFGEDIAQVEIQVFAYDVDEAGNSYAIAEKVVG